MAIPPGVPVPQVDPSPPADDTAAPARRSGGVWQRLRGDRSALAGLVIVAVLLLVALLAPVLTALNGHPPNVFYSDRIDSASGGVPIGRFGGIDREFWLGVEPGTGRDLFSRLVHGARVSLLIALLATALSVLVGTVLGLLAGYLGGWVDAAISRLMDLLLAFPVLVFQIAIVAVVRDVPRIPLLVALIALFAWPYLGRIVRGQAVALRDREFVVAARALGAGHRYVVGRELLPNLAGPILVYATLLVPTTILTEAALTFLGVGVRAPTASWGGMLADAVDWYATEPLYVLIPGLALFVTVLAFNLLGDGLRTALDVRDRPGPAGRFR